MAPMADAKVEGCLESRGTCSTEHFYPADRPLDRNGLTA
jgi:hypothetical protein